MGAGVGVTTWIYGKNRKGIALIRERLPGKSRPTQASLSSSSLDVASEPALYFPLHNRSTPDLFRGWGTQFQHGSRSEAVVRRNLQAAGVALHGTRAQNPFLLGVDRTPQKLERIPALKRHSRA